MKNLFIFVNFNPLSVYLKRNLKFNYISFFQHNWGLKTLIKWWDVCETHKTVRNDGQTDRTANDSQDVTND